MSSNKVKDRNRICKECSKPFTLNDGGLYKYCSVECRNKTSNRSTGTKYRKSGKGKQAMFAWRLRTVYGLTVQGYEEILAKQNHSCAICERVEPTGYGWHVDHCHSTNKIRGILCSKCNQGIGLLDDKIETLKKAIKYLEDSRHTG